MIPQAFINEWRSNAPWISEAQVEQDLILTRALIEIYSDPLMFTQTIESLVRYTILEKK